MKVTVVLALPGQQAVVEVDLPEGATAGDALAASGLVERFPAIVRADCRLGLWNKPCAPGALLREGDRVEVHRELQADAKALRRSRVVRPSKRARSGR
jgi:uncharacterized protein